MLMLLGNNDDFHDGIKEDKPKFKSKSKKDRLAQKKVAIALDEDLARFNALLNGSRPSSTVIETTKTLNKKHSSNSNSNSNLPIPSPPTKKKSTDLKPPVLHFIDV